MDDFDATGRWWLPDSDDHVCKGSLVLDRSQFALAVEAPLTPLPELVPGQAYTDLWEARRHAVVYGELRDGTAVTLADADGLATLLPFAEGTEAWRPHAAFLGAHLPDLGTASFVKASVVLSHLREFAGSPAAAIRWEYEEGTRNTTYAMVEAHRRVLQSATVPGAQVELVVSPIPRMTAGRGEIGINVAFEITLDKPRIWGDIWSAYVLPLRDLLAVLLDRSIDVGSLKLTSPNGESGRLLLRLVGPLLASDRIVATHDFLLNAATLPGGFSDAVPAWVQLRERTAKAVAEMVDVVNSPHMYADDRLVSYVRAVGPLCDEVVNTASNELADTEHTRWLTEVSDALPEHLREGVIGRLTPLGPNERHRMIALIESLDATGRWLAGGDVGRFAQRVIATRNGIAHPSRTPPRQMLADRALVAHMAQLGWILRAVLLNRIGMPLEDVTALLQTTAAASYAEELRSSNA